MGSQPEVTTHEYRGYSFTVQFLECQRSWAVWKWRGYWCGADGKFHEYWEHVDAMNATAFDVSRLARKVIDRDIAAGKLLDREKQTCASASLQTST